MSTTSSARLAAGGVRELVLCGQLRLVAVVVAHPFHLVEGVPFVSPLRRQVEQAVGSHHHLHTASVSRIGVKGTARFVLPKHADSRPFLERMWPRAVVIGKLALGHFFRCEADAEVI